MDIQYMTQCESIASHANKRVAELEQEVKDLKEQIRQMQELKTEYFYAGNVVTDIDNKFVYGIVKSKREGEERKQL